jgi:tetratricopeptide (TPR) repeat protein
VETLPAQADGAGSSAAAAAESAVRHEPVDAAAEKERAPTRIRDHGLAESAAAPRPVDPALLRRPPSASAHWPWVLALLVALAGVAFAWRELGDRRTTSSERSAAAPRPSDAVAVLPVDIAATEDAAWVRLGLMDLIAGRLQSAGLAVVPSENVAALVRAAKDPLAQAVPEATGARFLVSPVASRVGNEWLLRLRWHSTDGEDHAAEARDADVITAARNATDNLLLLLGRSRPPVQGEAIPAEVLSRARAAMLIDDLDGARRLLDSVPAQAQQAAEWNVLRAQVDYRGGRFADARQRLETLLAHVSGEADPVLRARILDTLGAVLARVDSPESARRAFDEALVLLASRNEPAELGRAYSGRAVSNAIDGRYDLASSDFAQARIALQLSGDTLTLALLESNEGILEIRRNHQAAALPLLEHASASLERMGALSGLAIATAELVEARLAMLEPAQALATAERVWPRFAHQDTPPKRLLAYKRARALTAVGRLADASASLGEVLESLDRTQEAPLLAEVQLQQAVLEAMRGRFDETLTLARQAIDGLISAEDARPRALAWLLLLRATRAQDRIAEAGIETQRLIQWSRSSTDATALTYANLAEAEQAAAEHRAEVAAHRYEQVLRSALKDGVPIDIVTVVASYADVLLASNDLAGASVVIGHIARWADHDFDCALLQTRLYHALGQPEAWREAFDQAEKLAGERTLPSVLRSPPTRAAPPGSIRSP